MQRLSGRTCLLDSNVLVYALDRESSFYVQAAHLLTENRDGRISCVIAHQNLLELLHVLTAYYKLPVDQAMAAVRAYEAQPRLGLISPSAQTLGLSLRLIPSGLPIRRVNVFDLYLAATMRDHGIETVVTANTRDFTGIEGLQVVDLGSLMLE